MWSGPQLKQYVLLHQVSLGWRNVCGRKAKGKINMKPDWPILERNGEAVSVGGRVGEGGGAATAFPYHFACGSASLSLSEITCHACEHGCHRRCCKRPTRMNGCNWSVECGDGNGTQLKHLTTLHSSLWLLSVTTLDLTIFICRIHVPLDSQRSAVFFLRKFSNAAKVEDVENVASIHRNCIAKFDYKPDINCEGLND
jgi:hypothetical protein